MGMMVVNMYESDGEINVVHEIMFLCHADLEHRHIQTIKSTTQLNS